MKNDLLQEINDEIFLWNTLYPPVSLEKLEKFLAPFRDVEELEELPF